VTAVLGFLAQLLHIALVAVAAPTLLGLRAWFEARLAGRRGPSPLQPWRDLARLLRKQVLLSEASSELGSAAPVAAAAATAVAAVLVPSFALGMSLTPFADLLLVFGLLATARCALALAAADAGTAQGGIAASRVMLYGCLAGPALLLVLLVLNLLTGSLNIGVIAAMQAEAGTGWRIGGVIAFAALLLVALSDTMRPDELAQDFGGAELALIDYTAALRVLIWFDLIGALFLPFGMAPLGGGFVAWAIGLGCWAVRTLWFSAALAMLHTVLGRVSRDQALRWYGIAVLLGLLAAAFLFTETGAV
jgi:formate hydrogenlyase subunit 4